ncbi:DNA alkylation repair protein [Thermodesulfobacteriota bacterium]
MQYREILNLLESLSDPNVVKGMAKFGINPGKRYGISIPNLQKIAKMIGKDHSLAARLWSSGISEARILACMIDDPKMVTEEQMEKWVKGFDSWDVCDQCCNRLFGKTGFAYQQAIEWSERTEEFVKRASFVLMAQLALHDKNADDSLFEQFLPIIKREAMDRRNFVKKAINWALRQIGKRNRNLNRAAAGVAKEIQQIDTKSARWIASNALLELLSDKIQQRIC